MRVGDVIARLTEVPEDHEVRVWEDGIKVYRVYGGRQYPYRPTPPPQAVITSGKRVEVAWNRPYFQASSGVSKIVHLLDQDESELFVYRDGTADCDLTSICGMSFQLDPRGHWLGQRMFHEVPEGMRLCRICERKR